MAYQFFSVPCPITVGCGAIAILGDEIKNRGLKKPLIVFDAGVKEAGIPDKVIKILDEAGLDYACFDGVHADPSVDVVDACAAVAKAEGVDCLIGVGGGSSMDTAKATSIFTSGFEGDARFYVRQTPIKVETTTPVFLVPTTTGTGAECTSVAIISVPEKNVKWSVNVNTTLGVVDPELTVTLPPLYTATTGLDALAHATEGITASTSNIHATYMGLGAVRKIADHLVDCYNHPTDINARTEMAIAADWAGMAFNNPLTHLSHAMGDAFGCHFHTPHGLSCSLGLADTMRLVAEARKDDMKVIAEAMRIELTGSETGRELGELVAQKIFGMMHAMNMPSLKSLGCSREEIVGLAKEVTENHLCTHSPIPVTLELMEKLLGDVYDNYQ
ncbi:MAG: iron-containing alcohol dehydrogenase [Oscillospiraceae bacterium]|nr:iron-containing alcohol dehydrogenase [Oscillospiraceae bacterium]